MELGTSANLLAFVTIRTPASNTAKQPLPEHCIQSAPVQNTPLLLLLQAMQFLVPGRILRSQDQIMKGEGAKLQDTPPQETLDSDSQLGLPTI